MSIKRNEIEAIVETLIEDIKDELQTQFEKEIELNYAIQFLQSKMEEFDIED
jgi:ribosomal protein S17E